VRCLIVDDSADFRYAASAMFERGVINVVGVASNSAEALRLCRDLQPEVALVDVDLGAESGFELAQQLHRGATTPLSVILMSTYAEVDLAEMIAASPAVGFLPKFALSPGAILDLVDRHRASR
jgi:CheY-like chemotaxis protein